MPARKPPARRRADVRAIRALALPCAVAQFAAEGVCRGLGDTKPPLRAALLAGLMNVRSSIPSSCSDAAGTCRGRGGDGDLAGVCLRIVVNVLNGKRGNRAPSTIEAPSAKEGISWGRRSRFCCGRRASWAAHGWARAIAAHGVVLKVWLLFVLAGGGAGRRGPGHLGGLPGRRWRDRARRASSFQAAS